MNRIAHTLKNYKRRQHRTRTGLTGSSDRPRLSVNVSNLHVTAQIIDDTKHQTIVYSTSVGAKMDGNMTKKAELVGKDIAKKAAKVKIKKVVFDRGGRLYHGRIKALADAAREAGLEF